MPSHDCSHLIWDQFEEKSRGFADRIAVSSAAGDITFGRLYADAGSLAERLARVPIRPGSIACHTMKNGVEFVMAYLALCKLSAAVALVPEKFRKQDIRSLTEALEPHCFITNESLYAAIGRELPEAKSLAVPIDGGSEAVRVVIPPAADDRPDSPHPGGDRPDDFGRPVALVKFTSGSTGLPKAVALSVHNVLAEARSVVETLNIGPDDRILAAVPLSHSYGFDLGVLAMLYSGARLIVHESFIPRKALRDLEQQRVTIFLGVPSMYKVWLDTRLEKRPQLSHVRYLLSCTAPLSARTVRDFNAKFGVPICQHYGSSETGAVANHIPDEILRRPDSVGKAMKNVPIRVVAADGTPVLPGAEGEVVVAGDGVALGYLMGKPEHRDSLRAGSYWTGDVGYLDADGFLYIRGRVDQVINVGGHKVSPDEVALALEDHPAVREAGVVGIKDSDGGEIIVGVVALNGPADEGAILKFCRDRLAAYKVPRRIIIMPELPKGPSGKVRVLPEDIAL